MGGFKVFEKNSFSANVKRLLVTESIRLTLIALFHNISLNVFDFYIIFFVLLRKLNSLITAENTVDLKSLISDVPHTPNKFATPTKQPKTQLLSQLTKQTSK